MGIPCAYSPTLTLAQIAKVICEGEAHVTRVLGNADARKREDANITVKPALAFTETLLANLHRYMRFHIW